MYFSAKQLFDYLNSRPYYADNTEYFAQQYGETNGSKRAIARIHKRAMNTVLARESREQGSHNPIHVGKWFRPWEIVPELKNWEAPEGDFGVGIEVELGFPTKAAAQSVAQKVKNWRYITLDFEGGTNPIEATFPPTRYSKFNSNSQACRYLKLVNGIATRHNVNNMVGTHINVSKGGSDNNNYSRAESVSSFFMHSWHTGYALTETEYRKYFGRMPYGGVCCQDGYYECKMFNSVTDWKILRRYVDIAVSLIDLIEGTAVINATSVRAALEHGYNLRS